MHSLRWINLPVDSDQETAEGHRLLRTIRAFASSDPAFDE